MRDLRQLGGIQGGHRFEKRFILDGKMAVKVPEGKAGGKAQGITAPHNNFNPCCRQCSGGGWGEFLRD